MKNLLILYDYRKYFSTKFVGTVDKHVGTTMDVDNLKKLFEEKGFNVQTCEMAQLDYSQPYKDWYVIYASSEDQGLFYKEYIEDILLILKRKGAILIPEFDYFRAHCNKSYQEMMRRQFSNAEMRCPSAFSIGEITELDSIKDRISFPVVLKISYGSGSRGVILVKTSEDLEASAKSLMNHKYYDFGRTYTIRLGLFAKRLFRRIAGKRINNEPLLFSLNTNKIVVEEFIPNLSGDYKVLVFGKKYYVLNRKNRKNDFRASGSGEFAFPDKTDEIDRVLNFANICKKEIKMPVMSLDIAENETGIYLLEFQCVFFGPYTLQYAPHCFIKEGENWLTEKGSFDLEKEYVQSVSDYISL